MFLSISSLLRELRAGIEDLLLQCVCLTVIIIDLLSKEVYHCSSNAMQVVVLYIDDYTGII